MANRRAAAPAVCRPESLAPRWLVLTAMWITGGLLVLLIAMLIWKWYTHVPPVEGYADGDGDGDRPPAPPKALLVFVHMKGCSWCEKFEPVWARFEEEHGDALSSLGVKLASYERSEKGAEPLMKHVKGFPTVLLVKHKTGAEDDVIVFEDERTPAALVKFVEAQMGFEIADATKPRARAAQPKEAFEVDEPTEFGALVNGVSAAKKAADGASKSRQKNIERNSGGKITTSAGGKGGK